ncbi:GATA zinc finger domain-containing protein 14-like [Phymastichus coffea]|uniref:GATA zinc finger domain-containing protein 14-like n=1 Tax=Phymastichus coffea TaxID=108790 RepID=UPI00273B8BA3|nr:GATA zinc finger domain-containing protein 14-like [Phymastichus coffea]XP_058804175.1 GATA zinc finger domain-containing protein 14-like [Phymastichus coffea]XP_058804177.1 GATA zinc finger domain-containing protein 14-like [Phymastichus coffea]
MVSRVIGAIAIAVSLASVFGEPQQTVRLNERHLRALSEDQLRSQQQQQQQQQDEGEDARYGWEDSVPGVPGRDYPNLTSIPATSFSCAGKTAGGYYADVETRCQVFHVCSTQGLKSSFLCPSGSIFNQRHFVCDWWYDFICEQALELYSLNDALNDPNSSTDPPLPSTSDDITDRYNQLPLTPIQFNSIAAGSNADLSLASSGYTNNLRDETNLIYEDYNNNAKTAEKSAVLATSGILDNYSDARRKESMRSYEEQQQQQQQQQYRQQPIYRRRPSQGPDNVPRGFSKPPPSNDQSRELERGEQGPGFFVNNGLSDTFRDQNYQLAAENNNFIDNTNYYKLSDNENVNFNIRNVNNNYSNKVTDNESSNFNGRNTINNNQNYNTRVTNNQNANVNTRNLVIKNENYNIKLTNSESTNFNTRSEALNSDNHSSKATNSDNTNFNSRGTEAKSNDNFNNVVYTQNNNNNNLNDYNNFYQNSVQYPLPQENNNYDNNFNTNLVNVENQNENYYNTIRIYNTEYNNKYNSSSNSFSNVNYDNNNNNFNSVNYNTDSNYSNYNNNNFNSNVNYQDDGSNKSNNNNNNNNYESKFQTNYQKPIHVESSTVDYNFQEDHYETTINPDFLINSGPSEEEVDRERQREVDSVDLKRQRPSTYTRQYTDAYTSAPGFLIREETSWRDDLSTSSSGSQSPPFPPERNYESTPTLPRPEETTTPVTISTRQPKEPPKYLGKRPAGGLLGGAGNGLPGANKNLAASNAITGKPIDESSTNSLSSVDDGYSTYRPPQGFTASPKGQDSYSDAGYRLEGQYWNDGKESWNDGRRYTGRY